MYLIPHVQQDFGFNGPGYELQHSTTPSDLSAWEAEALAFFSSA